MRVIFFGDVVGNGGSSFLADKLQILKGEFKPDVVIANGENSAKGNGITPISAQYMFSRGVDVITTGNHAFRRKEVLPLFETEDCLLRPINFPEGVIGKGVCIVDKGAYKLAVVNVMGVAYMDDLDNPFFSVTKALESLETPNIIVDFHAEATAEKKCMGHFLTGKVSAVLGTHTHVQTADETILGGHTAYITDVGMTGPEDSVLGVETSLALERMKLHMPVRFSESNNPSFLNAVVLDIDHKSGAASNIQRIILR